MVKHYLFKAYLLQVNDGAIASLIPAFDNNLVL